MTVQKIFETPAIKEIEEEMIHLEEDIERCHFRKPGGKDAMRTLIGIRRNLLANMFVMDEHYKTLLSEFNEALMQQLIRMRQETIKAVRAVENAGVTGDIQGIGKCFLGYRYSKLHPVQTMRAKKIWAILNGSISDYVRSYDDGVSFNGYVYDIRMKPESENEMLYLSDEIDNWNDELDMEMTRDMHIIFPVHNLISHTDFSIFDLLWVRDFCMEIYVESDYGTYSEEEEGECIEFI